MSGYIQETVLKEAGAVVNFSGGPGDGQASSGGAQAAAGATSGAGETPSSPAPPLTP